MRNKTIILILFLTISLQAFCKGENMKRIPDIFLHKNKKINSMVEWETKKTDIKERLYDTIGRPPFKRNTGKYKVVQEEKVETYSRQKITYTVGDQDIIYAYLLIPDNRLQHNPAVLALHQYDADKGEVVGIKGRKEFAYGLELVKRGYVVLAPDCITAGERIETGYKKFDSASFYKKYPLWSTVGKNIEDTKSAVDVIYQLDFVDKERIGVIGHSHGGHNSIFGMALDDRIKVGVSNCGLSVFELEEMRMAWSTENGYIYIPKLREYFLENKRPPFDINEVAALIPPRPWLNISAYYDFAYGNQEFLADVGIQMYQLYKMYKQEHNFSFFMHGNNHSFPEFSRELAFQWLSRHLKN